MHVKGKVCVVTGAASGIGEAVARAYAQAGARGVVVADLKTSRDRLAAVAGDIDGLAVTADVGLEADVKALIAAAEDKYGPVDVFFSNAGLSRKGQEGASDADWDVSWRVHVMSHVFAARALVPVMLARGSGYLLNTASARRTSRHPIWRPRHPRIRAVPAIGANGDDDPRPQRRARRWRAAAAGSGAHGDRGDGSRTLPHPVAPAGRRIHATQGLQPGSLADRHAAAA
jgi:NAD(P)-dependent dehydrogenase (short-subunit alcohol dehydrogenase family)